MCVHRLNCDLIAYVKKVFLLHLINLYKSKPAYIQFATKTYKQSIFLPP